MVVSLGKTAYWILGYATFRQRQLGNLGSISLVFMQHIVSKLGAMYRRVISWNRMGHQGGDGWWNLEVATFFVRSPQVQNVKHRFK